MATLEENKRVARRYPEEIATEGRFHLVDEVCIEDVVSHSPFGESRGREAVREQTEATISGIPDFSATVQDIFAESDKVAMRVRIQGTHEGEFMGLEPTGNSFDIQNMVITRLEDGKIAERWIVPDLLGALQQLGAVELPIE